jgi:hypothetical protein
VRRTRFPHPGHPARRQLKKGACSISQYLTAIVPRSRSPTSKPS